MTARSSLFLAALMLASSSPAQTTRPVPGQPAKKTYAVRHVFRPGEKLLLVSKTDFEATFRSEEGGPGRARRIREQGEWELTPASADKGEGVLVRMKVLRWRSESEGNGQKKTTDLSKPETLRPEEREGLPVILEAVFSAELHENGSVREVTIPEDVVAAVRKGAKLEQETDEDSFRKKISAPIRQLLESVTVYQPPGPVFVGEAWAVERKDPQTGVQTKTEYTLAGVERTAAGRIATITFKLRGGPDAAGQGRGRKQEGQARYNVDRQRFVSSKVESLESSGNGTFETKRSASVELRAMPAPTTRPASKKNR